MIKIFKIKNDKKVLATASFLCYVMSVKFFKPMDNKFMSLLFFAKRVGVSVRRLNWCIVCTTNEDGETNETPAISIKGASVCFNILTDTLEPLVNVGGCETSVIEATMSETADGYEFRTSGGKCIELTFEEIDEVYANKVFSEELNRKAQRFA